MSVFLSKAKFLFFFPQNCTNQTQCNKQLMLIYACFFLLLKKACSLKVFTLVNLRFYREKDSFRISHGQRVHYLEITHSIHHLSILLHYVFFCFFVFFTKEITSLYAKDVATAVMHELPDVEEIAKTTLEVSA